MSLTQREIEQEILECSAECPTCGSTEPHDERTCVPPCSNCGASGHEAGDCTLCKVCMEDHPRGYCVSVVSVIDNDEYWEPDWCEHCGLYCGGWCFWHDDEPTLHELDDELADLFDAYGNLK